ncbi:MAG: DegT/DnrJ/EryC1/StrS family aminotransferase [Endomicrobia bacterium]|nr:DegT/DnrJ/EryC1/StrS family aminotransferase [Endomicrobiia bacterium]
MKIRYPFGTITITEKTKKLIKEILDSRKISQGKYVKEFEKEFAELVGTKYAVAVSSGTDAVALALAVFYDYGAKRGDEVILPALSFVATGNAVLQAGFTPKFVDIERTTLNINPKKIEEVITEKTKIILPVHLMGKPAEMDEIMEIAKKYKLYVVEDAAEAQSAVYKSRNIGTIGDMAAFSLYIAHIISTGEGGAVTTNRSDFAEVLRSLRVHGRACKCETCILSSSQQYCDKRFKYGSDVRFIFERVGFSSKMNELEAAIGLGYLEIYDDIYKKRMENLKYLMEKFKKFEEYFYTLKQQEYELLAPYAFPVVLKENVKFTRDEFVAYLEKNGVETRSLFQSIPTECGGFKFLGYKYGDFPEAEYVSKNGFHLGIHQDIGEEEIDWFIHLTEEFLENKL